MNLRHIVFLLMMLASLASCLRYTPSRSELGGTGGSTGLAGEQEFHAYESEQRERLTQLLSNRREVMQSGVWLSSYQIGIGDLVGVKVFGFDDLNATARVDQHGLLSLPLIGQVSAAGKSEAALQAELQEMYKVYVRVPQVQIALLEYEAHKVSVIGAVIKPGVYPLKRPDYSLTELLSEAGGRKDNASSRLIIIPKSALPTQADGDQGRVAGVEVDIDDLIGGADRMPVAVPLASGDTIIVPEAGSIEVDGEVNKPGSYPLSAKTSTLGAIAAAGGLTYSANVHEVEVIREIGGGKKASVSVDLEQLALKGGTDIRLRDGDFVRVPSHSGRFNTRQAVEVLNGMFRVGVSGSVR